MRKLPFLAGFLLCCCWLLPNIAAAQTALEGRLDFQVEQQTLAEAIWSLSEQTQIPVAFNNRDFDDQRYSFSFQQELVAVILSTLLDKVNLTYNYSNGQIRIIRKAAPDRTISGYVEDELTGERLIGAHVYPAGGTYGTATNAYGFFSISVPATVADLAFSYLGYQNNTLILEELGNSPQLVSLKSDYTLEEVVVRPRQSQDVSVMEQAEHLVINPALTDKLPSLGGEADLLNNLRLLPGTQNGTDGFGGLHIRGGNADQNLVLLDGAPIYNPYHALGLSSIFDNTVIKKATYLRGHFPARFGGRISSVVDVRTRDGNQYQHNAHFSTGLIASKVSVEGPSLNKKATFLLSARRSHLDPFLERFSRQRKLDKGQEGTYNYHFYDFLGKMSWQPSLKDRVYASIYHGRDVYVNETGAIEVEPNTNEVVEEKQGLNWGNSLVALGWNRSLGKKLFLNANATYSIFQFNALEEQSFYFPVAPMIVDTFRINATYDSKIESYTAKASLNYVPSLQHNLRFGMSVSRNNFRPGVEQGVSGFIDENPVLGETTARLITAWEWRAYAEDEWQLSQRMLLNVGLSASLFRVDERQYLQLDPRLAVYWQATEKLKWQLSANRMSQNLHVLTRTGTGFPNDLWVPSTGKVRPQKAWLFDMGASWQLASKWNLNTNVYWKEMRQLLDYQEQVGFNLSGGNNVLNSANWEDNVTSGQGESRGVELMIHHKNKKTTAWISYTLSKTTRQFDNINNGLAYPSRFDQRHALSFVGLRSLSKRWEVSTNWTFNTGSSISIPLSKWRYIRQDSSPDLFFFDFGPKNSYQLPAYHRLDLQASYRSKEQARHTWRFQFGVSNLYNRRNIYTIKTEINVYAEAIKRRSVSFVPLLPYFNFSIDL